MELLRSLSRSFVSGCVGTVGLFAGAYLFIAAGLIDAPQMVETFQSKAFIYKLVVWGGIWGFLLSVPLLRPHWWARGPIVGTLATIAAIFVFQPAVPPLIFVVYAFVLNAIFWGLSAAFWRDRVMTEKL